MIYIKHDNGKIMGWGQCPGGMATLQGGIPAVFASGVTFPVDPDNMKINVVTEEIEERADNNVTLSKSTVIANGVDFVLVSNIPVNAELKISGPSVFIAETILSGSETITFDTAGEYELYIDCYPLKNFKAVIDAN